MSRQEPRADRFIWKAGDIRVIERAEGEALSIEAMFSEANFNSAIVELARLNGISEDVAGDYLARIGDAPELAEDGRVIVRSDAGAEIARLIWPE